MSATWHRLRRQKGTKAFAAVLILLTASALFADLLASDRPLAIRLDGDTWVLPVLTDPPALRHRPISDLRAAVAASDDAWMIEPLIPYGPKDVTLAARLEPPSCEHLLGTDELGRDVLARIIHGGRVSLAVGFSSVALYVLIGLLLGGLAGWFGGKVDAFISRLTEVMLSFPTIFLVLCVVGLLRSSSLLPLVILLGLWRWTDVSRLVRAEVLRLREQEFISASRALGASDLRIIVSHLLPNALGPVLVAAAFGVGGAILIETALSFLGFGVPPPTASWGELLTQANRYVTYPGAWWLAVFPGLAIFLTVFSFNLVGEGLRDAMDPKLRG